MFDFMEGKSLRKNRSFVLLQRRKKNFPSAIIPVWNHVFATSLIEMKIIIKIIIFIIFMFLLSELLSEAWNQNYSELLQER